MWAKHPLHYAILETCSHLMLIQPLLLLSFHLQCRWPLPYLVVCYINWYLEMLAEAKWNFNCGTQQDMKGWHSFIKQPVNVTWPCFDTGFGQCCRCIIAGPMLQLLCMTWHLKSHLIKLRFGLKVDTLWNVCS